ncbi:MAG TPA: 3-dehydroquinate synthase [Pyrinomonadaceae bacterium]|nr:3-dehydroquinate synthase [Pyrinomonadaceae bacterium]
MQTVNVRVPAREIKYEIRIGSGLIADIGAAGRKAMGPGAGRAALISNRKVFNLFGEKVLHALRSSGFDVSVWLMKDGEQHKSMRSLAQAITFFSKSGLERNDAVVALGGGVVGDLAGFAAATYLRGVAFIQVPTTLLAQIDASVGGKTGVNTGAGKNLVGAFHQPRLVLIDTDTLQTLPQRELTAGWCEAIKQGAAGDRKLFDRTVRLLERVGTHASSVQHAGGVRIDVAATIAAHCRFKAAIVAGDEREATDRTDRRSRKILNFGHTTAHALEAVTNYRRFRHGEAVGHGMIVAAEISKGLGMLKPGELELLRSAVRACGPLPPADDVEIDKLIRAMKGDKKSVGGQIRWVLLDAIGSARIVDGREVSTRALRRALRAGLQTP